MKIHFALAALAVSTNFLWISSLPYEPYETGRSSTSIMFPFLLRNLFTTIFEDELKEFLFEELNFGVSFLDHKVDLLS